MHLKTIWPLEKLEMQLKKAAAASSVSEIRGSSEGRSAAARVTRRGEVAALAQPQNQFL